MRKRRIYLGVVGVVVLVGVLVVALRPEREPEYGGKKLSEWVDTIWKPMPEGTRDELSYSIRRFDETPVAMRTMGTNAVPYLLKWTQYEPGPLKTRVTPALNGLLRQFHFKWQIPKRDPPAYHRTYAAKYALFMLLDDPSGRSRASITSALQCMDRHLAVFAVPVLVDCLGDKNAEVMLAASNVLRQIDPQALERAGLQK